MKKIIKKHLHEILLLALLVVGFFVDIAIKHIGKALIYVDDGYLGSLFEVVCTVAVLGNAILSIIIGIAEQKVLGIPIQNALKKTRFGTNTLHSITITLATILLSTCAYAFEAYNTITLLLVFVVTVIGVSSIKIWCILSDVEEQKKIILEIICNSQSEELAAYIGSWFQHLQTAISLKDQNSIDRYLNLLENLNSNNSAENNSVTNCLELYLPDTFRIACKAYDFTYGYKLIERINHLNPNSCFEEENIVREYIREIKYSTADKIGIRNMNSTVSNIIRSNDIPYDVKWSVISELIHSLNNNAYLTVDDKKERLVSIMKCLCSLQDSDYGDIKADILLTVFRNEILLEDNASKREWLHLLIVEQLVSQNIFDRDRCFIQTISEMFRALFFYVHFETDTLSEVYRKGLENLQSISVTSKDASITTFSLLINQNRESIASWLAENSIAFNWRQGSRWDYYPMVRPFKNVLWERDNIIRFAYCYYKVIGSFRIGNPFISALHSKDISVDDKITLCKTITDLYSGNSLSDDVLLLIEKIAHFIGQSSAYNVYDDREHQFYQDMLLELKSKQNELSSPYKSISNHELIKMVCNEINQGRGLHIIHEIPDRPFTRQHLEPHFIKMSSNYLSISTHYICNAILEIINRIIARKLLQAKISFDKDGVQTLLNHVNGQKYRYRNYTYINDWALKNDVRSSNEYKKLCKLINDIQEDTKSFITSRVFLTVPQVHSKIRIDYRMEEPTELQCSQFVEAHEISDGCYQIDGLKLDYAHAIRLVRENYKVEYIKLGIHVDVNEETGFLISFRR